MNPKPKRATMAEFIFLLHYPNDNFRNQSRGSRLNWHRISSAIVCELERRQNERAKAETPAKRVNKQLMALKAKGQLKAFTDLMNGEEIVEQRRNRAKSSAEGSPSIDRNLFAESSVKPPAMPKIASQPEKGGSEAKP